MRTQMDVIIVYETQGKSTFRESPYYAHIASISPAWHSALTSVRIALGRVSSGVFFRRKAGMGMGIGSGR